MVKENLVWGGKNFELEWINSIEEIDFDKVEQVYGFLFDEKNKICLVRPTEKRGWRLPSGHPDPEDKDWKETAIREADEEADIEIDKNSLKIIGYIKATCLDDGKVGYKLRAIGKITKIKEQTEDIAEGLINERIFINPKEFLDYCPWNEIGKIQRDKAVEAYKTD